MTNSNETYRVPARWLHWGMALLVIAMIPVGRIMVEQGLDRALQNTLFIFHKNVGVLLLLLIVIRIIYRWRNPTPPEPAHLPAWQCKIANLSHVLLYVLLVIMPVSGYIRVKAGGFPIESLDAMGIPAFAPRSDALAEIAKATHFYASWLLLAIVLLHIGAALYHGIVKRDGVFSRMWPSKQG